MSFVSPPAASPPRDTPKKAEPGKDMLARLNRYFATTLTGIFLSRFALLGTIMLVITTLIHQVDAQRIVVGMQKTEQLELKAQRERLVRAIEAAAGDLLAARYTLELEETLQHQDAARRSKTIAQLTQLLLHRRRYFAAAIIDANGKEVVRLRHSQGRVEVLPPAGLRVQSGSHYFIEAMHLADGEVYHSPFDLNVEGGRLEQPLRPILRLSTPVHADGKRLGVFVLTLSGQLLLDRFREEASMLPSQAYIVNRFGHFLLSPNPEQEWGSVLADRLNHTFGLQDSAAWGRMRIAESGQFTSRSGLVTFETVVPALVMRRFTSGKEQPYADAASAPGEWKLISIVPESTLQQLTSPAGTGGWQLSAFGLFVAAVLAATLAWQRMTRLRGFRAVRDREARLRLVMDSVPAMIAYLDTQERYLFANRSFLDAFDLDEETLKTKSVRDVVGEQAYARVEPPMRDALAGKTVRYERQLETRDGTLDLDIIYAPHRNQSGVVLGFFAMLVDLSERKRLERVRSHFVSMVSHEMRAPLTSILGALDEVLDAMPQENSEQRGMLEVARRNAERLTTVANDVLDLERMESDALKFSPRSIELSSVVLEAVQANRAAADQIQVGLRAVVRDEARVMADPDRLMQVLTNLISNAIKASPQGEWVTVSQECLGDRVRVSVIDRGPGIPQAFQAQVFERFAQARSSTAKSGSGLGLSISREIIQRSGGQIGFATAAGTGTTFWFELPLGGETGPV